MKITVFGIKTHRHIFTVPRDLTHESSLLAFTLLEINVRDCKHGCDY